VRAFSTFVNRHQLFSMRLQPPRERADGSSIDPLSH
jgi:hypothetical protein